MSGTEIPKPKTPAEFFGRIPRPVKSAAVLAGYGLATCLYGPVGLAFMQTGMGIVSVAKEYNRTITRRNNANQWRNWGRATTMLACGMLALISFSTKIDLPGDPSVNEARAIVKQGVSKGKSNYAYGCFKYETGIKFFGHLVKGATATTWKGETRTFCISETATPTGGLVEDVYTLRPRKRIGSFLRAGKKY